jgi:hypothetical protein
MAKSSDSADSVLVSFLRERGWFLIGVIVTALYSGYFILPGLHARFNGDDPMNLHAAWTSGGWELFKALILFFNPYHRPMGKLYFLTLYEFFGLNPLPYHIAITIFLLVNVILAYRCAALLSGSKVVGLLCAIITSYHAKMSQSVYLPAFIFDVLCFTFFFASLFYYLRIRSAGRNLGVKELLIFMLLYIAALESKEMAVTLPMMLLVYEFLWHPPDRPMKNLLKWVRSNAIPSLIACFITVVYVVGKAMGPEALMKKPGYHMTISLRMFLDSQAKFFKELFYMKPERWFNAQWLIILWLLMVYVAYRRRENHLKWAMLMTVITPLPIAFIQGRGGICLSIPWFGWTLWLAVMSVVFIDFISKEPVFRKLPRTWARAIPLALIVALIWNYTYTQNKKIRPDLQVYDEYFWSLKEQLNILLPSVKPGTQIAFYNDGIDAWDALFITELFFHDRSVKVRLHRYNPLSPEEFTKMDYVLNMDDQLKLTILKRPGELFQIPAGLPQPSLK